MQINKMCNFNQISAMFASCFRYYHTNENTYVLKGICHDCFLTKPRQDNPLKKIPLSTYAHGIILVVPQYLNIFNGNTYISNQR